MNQIHFTVPFEAQKAARLGMPVTEWDARTVIGDTLMGVVESSDVGYMFTDTFGHLTTFEDGEEIHEVFAWVAESLNPTTVN